MGGNVERPRFQQVVAVNVDNRFFAWTVNLLLVAVYLGFFGLCVGALSALFGNESGSIGFGIVAGLIVSLGHFAMILLGIAVVQNYLLYPVYPRFIFFLVDVVTAVTAGLLIGFMDAKDPPVVIVAHLVLLLAMALQVFKVLSVTFGWFLYGDALSAPLDALSAPLDEQSAPLGI